MEVWLESLSMHLSVGMPLPPDLLFDIQHYRGLSPSSSGSTTPEGIPSGHRSPALEPIREGKMATTKKSAEKLYKSSDKLQKSSESLKPIIKVSSAENLLNNKRDNTLKPIIKVSSSDTLTEKVDNKEFCTKSCENVTSVIEKISQNIIADDAKEFPNYENIDFLKNDAAFVGDVEKPICIQKLDDTELKKDVDKGYCSLRSAVPTKYTVHQGNNMKDNAKFNVHLRKVPKNFTRNRFVKEIKENALKEDENSVVREKIKFLGKSRTFDVKPLANTTGKISNLNLDSIGLKSTTLPSQVTEKFMNNSKNVNINKQNLNKPQNVPGMYQRSLSNLENYQSDLIPDVVSSTLGSKPSCSSEKPNEWVKPSFSIGRHIFSRGDQNDSRASLMRRRYTKDSDNSPVLRRTPVLQRRCMGKPESVKDTVDLGQNSDNSEDLSCLHGKESKEVIKTKTILDSEKPSLLTKLTPILQRRTGFLKLEPCTVEHSTTISRKPFSNAASGSTVKSMVNSLNKKGGIDFCSRGRYGRSSLKLTGSPRVDLKSVGRSCSPTEEYTAL